MNVYLDQHNNWIEAGSAVVNALETLLWMLEKGVEDE